MNRRDPSKPLDEMEVLGWIQVGLSIPAITIESRLHSPAAWDSVRQVSLFVYLKKSHQIEISPFEIANLNTVRKIIDYIQMASM